MASKNAKAAGPENKGLRIVSRREGFRRAGYQFGADPVQIALSDLTEDQVDLLRGDPMLVVVDVDLQVGAGPSAK